MKNRIAVALFVFFSILTFFPKAPAQDSSEVSRKILARVAPQYPNIARSMNIQGSVRADVLVAANGTAKSVEVKGGHPLLGQSAQDALRQWKWEPASHETHEIVELKFKL